MIVMNIAYSTTPQTPVGGVPMDNLRRIFNLGERVAELAPLETPFFTYGSKIAKRPTDDPVFKFMEQRHQWQRRNFDVESNKAAAAIGTTLTGLRLGVKYDKYGRESATYLAPIFVLPNQVIAFRAGVGPSGGTYTPRIVTAKVTATGTPTTTYLPVDVQITAIDGDTNYMTTYSGTHIKAEAGAPGQVIGSAFAEGTGAPEGWMDSLYNREGYAQIFKTSIPLFSGTALATRYRGVANEYQRVWGEKLKEHKMDIEHAIHFGVGRVEPGVEDDVRYTWGILPYTERYGKVYPFTYADFTYDAWLDMMEDFHRPESGNSRDKLYLASRKVIKAMNKLGDTGFLKNSVGASSYRLDVQNIKGQFGHEVTKVNTIFGNAHFVEDPLLRGLWEDYVIAVDLKNVALRPLSANGVNRDTHITTNVQNNDIDGRKDLILTEMGVEIDLPETHAVLRFS